jgi:hypothetical protein
MEHSKSLSWKICNIVSILDFNASASCSDVMLASPYQNMFSCKCASPLSSREAKTTILKVPKLSSSFCNVVSYSNNDGNFHQVVDALLEKRQNVPDICVPPNHP